MGWAIVAAVLLVVGVFLKSFCWTKFGLKREGLATKPNPQITNIALTAAAAAAALQASNNHGYTI